MCLIIHKPKGSTIIPEHIIDNAETINPDGFGIVYTDTNECVRTMDYNTARELISAPRPFVAHYRYATRGIINKAGCHPYVIKSDTRGVTRLFSNGTVANLGDKKTCDTAIVSDILKYLPEEFWPDTLSFTETRFAITNEDGVQRYGDWHERDGIFYSKNNCFHTHYTVGYGYQYGGKSCWKGYEDDDDYWDSPVESANKVVDFTDDGDWEDVPLVAVYGTLKCGRSNHITMGSSVFKGTGETVFKYPMHVSNIPFVFERPGEGHNISVEVFETISDRTRENIDWLEGHPMNYERRLTDIQMTDGSVKTCWLYFANETYYDETMTNVQRY